MQAAEEEQETRDYPPTLITGAVGHVEHLWSKIDRRLKELGKTWTSMAKEVPTSRQYISDSIRRGSLPIRHFERICCILEWNVTEVLDLTYQDQDQ